MNKSDRDVTQLLVAARDGSDSAVSELFVLVYDELRALARARMAREPAGHTLQPTALVNEAYMRLVGSGSGDQPWHDRSYFFAAAGQAMRRILVERARRHAADKRGGDQRRVTLDEAIVSPQSSDVADGVLAVDQALEELHRQDPELAQLAQLKFFVGMSSEEMAAALGLSLRTAERRWTRARAFLLSRLNS